MAGFFNLEPYFSGLTLSISMKEIKKSIFYFLVRPLTGVHHETNFYRTCNC